MLEFESIEVCALERGFVRRLYSHRSLAGRAIDRAFWTTARTWAGRKVASTKGTILQCPVTQKWPLVRRLPWDED
jgi:hypothetical protein